MIHKKEVKIGLLGCGQVGKGLVKLLHQQADFIKQRTGIVLKIEKILVRNIKKSRGVPRHLLTNKPDEVIFNLETDIIVELIGGLNPAKQLIIKALKAGKNVVTANKAVLAHFGPEIMKVANDCNKQIYYEASVCAGVPVIRSIKDGLLANRIDSLIGILNGTSNYIITRMTEQGESFSDALKQAQNKGFAEPDPSFDIKGVDVAHKLAVLASLAFGTRATLKDIYVEGITSLSQDDIKSAEKFGYVIKLLAFGRIHSDNKHLELRVHPTMIPKNHPIASVRNEFNAILLTGDAVGRMMFYGRGAGPMPTSSALLSDIIELSTKIVSHNIKPENIYWSKKRIVHIDNVESEYYLRFPIFDRAGVIGKITEVLGKHGISIYGANAALVPSKRDLGNVLSLIHI